MLVEDFTLAPTARKALARHLSTAGVAEAAIPEIEQAATTFRVLLASRGPTRETTRRLRQLAEASEGFRAALIPPGGLEDHGHDLVTQTVMRLGYSKGFLARLDEAHRILERAIDAVDADTGRRLARGGRPREVARDWLRQQLEEILRRHYRPTRQKVLELLARQGRKAPTRMRSLPMRECEGIIVRAVAEASDGRPTQPRLPTVPRKVKNLTPDT